MVLIAKITVNFGMYGLAQICTSFTVSMEQEKGSSPGSMNKDNRPRQSSGYAPLNPNQQRAFIMFGVAVVSVFTPFGIFGILLSIFAAGYWVIGEIRLRNQMVLMAIYGPEKYQNQNFAPQNPARDQGLKDPSK